MNTAAEKLLTHLGTRRPGLLVAIPALLIALLAALLTSVHAVPRGPQVKPPQTLQDTGLYSNFAALQIDSRHLAFSPQYPLWTDGAAKRRWISLPPGTAIDASDPDAWLFPIGTRLWKEFAFGGRRIETRYLERLADGEWLFAAYAWSPDGKEARLAPERGVRSAYDLGGGRSHTIPGTVDCQICHKSGRTEVLGFSALQLSPERDPNAVHSDVQPGVVDLRTLVEKGLLVGLPQSMLDSAPRIVARSATEQSALGYLHGNCGHCHNQHGPLKNIGMFLRQTAGSADQSAIATTVGQPVRTLAPGQPNGTEFRIEPGHPERSGLAQRVGSRYPAMQMPPLGTELVDEEAVSLLRRWISEVEAEERDLAGARDQH
jgi:hypothetical protein